jgi:hypothetical protein
MSRLSFTHSEKQKDRTFSNVFPELLQVGDDLIARQSRCHMYVTVAKTNGRLTTDSLSNTPTEVPYTDWTDDGKRSPYFMSNRNQSRRHPKVSLPQESSKAEPALGGEEEEPHSVSAESYGLYGTTNDDDLLVLIQTGIEYTQGCIKDRTHPRVTRRFPIGITNPPSKILTTLRQAAKRGIAHLVFSKPEMKCYELGVPPAPVPVGYPYFSSGSPQWWVGLSAAQIRAGPMAQPSQVREAERWVEEKAERDERKKRNKNSKMNLELAKLEEGLRRQKMGLPMYDLDEKGS